MGETNSRSPAMDQGMMGATQDFNKVYRQTCGVTATRHMHQPPSNDRPHQEELMMFQSYTGTTQDKDEERLLREKQPACNRDNVTGSGVSADRTT